MSKMDFFFNLSPLNTTVSRKVMIISFSDISTVNLMVGWNLLACSINLDGTMKSNTKSAFAENHLFETSDNIVQKR